MAKRSDPDQHAAAGTAGGLGGAAAGSLAALGSVSAAGSVAAPGMPGALGAPPLIADKLYFRIGEVAALCRVPTYVLRFWQGEFAQLRPGKSGTGQRLYRRRDVEMALRIRQLLHGEGYTLAGAKAVLAAEAGAGVARRQTELPLTGGDVAPQPEAGEAQEAGRGAAQARIIQMVQGELRDMLGLLGAPAPGPPAAGTAEPRPGLSADSTEPAAPE